MRRLITVCTVCSNYRKLRRHNHLPLILARNKLTTIKDMMLEYRVISPNRTNVNTQEAKTFLLREQDPFLSLVRPMKTGVDNLDEEFLTLKKSYERQKRLSTVSIGHQKKTELFPIATKKTLPALITAAEFGNALFKYKLPSLFRFPQKLNDPVIISWLKNDFESDENSSVPRGLMYEAYAEFCRVNKHCITNQACFGKSVRSVFPKLQTRRIGVRGKSKYHYFGLRAKPGTETADLISRKQGSTNRAIRSHRKLLRMEQQDKLTQMTTVKMLSLGSLSNIIHTLIPDFPTIESMNVSETIINEARVFLQCSELYAAQVLRATIKIDFQEFAWIELRSDPPKSYLRSPFHQPPSVLSVTCKKALIFSATAAFWKTVRLIITDDTMLSHPDMLKLISQCDTRLQAVMRDILMPDLSAIVPDVRRSVLETLFGGVYLREMMSVTKPAPDKVLQVKKEVYRKFSKDILERLHFTKLLQEVQHFFENCDAFKSLKKALLQLDLDNIVSRCRFAFIIKKSKFTSTETHLRQGLSELQDILKNSFYARNVLQWVKLKLLGLLRTDAQRIRQKEMTKLVLLCFSYAIGLVINELEKCIQAESRGGFRKLQLLLTDYVCFIVQEELNKCLSDNIKSGKEQEKLNKSTNDNAKAGKEQNHPYKSTSNNIKTGKEQEKLNIFSSDNEKAGKEQDKLDTCASDNTKASKEQEQLNNSKRGNAKAGTEQEKLNTSIIDNTKAGKAQEKLNKSTGDNTKLGKEQQKLNTFTIESTKASEEQETLNNSPSDKTEAGKEREKLNLSTSDNTKSSKEQEQRNTSVSGNTKADIEQEKMNKSISCNDKVGKEQEQLNKSVSGNTKADKEQEKVNKSISCNNKAGKEQEIMNKSTSDNTKADTEQKEKLNKATDDNNGVGLEQDQSE